MNTQAEFVDLGDLLRVLRKRVATIALMTALSLALGLAYLSIATPMFRATALVQFDPRGKTLLEPQSDQPLAPATENARIESEVGILKSDAIALETIAAAGLASVQGFGPSLGLIDKVRVMAGGSAMQDAAPDSLVLTTLSQFRKAVDIRRQGQTYLITVAASASDPVLAARIANTHAETYIARQIAAKVDDAVAAHGILQGRVAEARTTLTDADYALGSFIDMNIDRLTTESGSARLLDLRQRMAVAETGLQDEKALLQNLGDHREQGDFQAMADALGDAALASLVLQEQGFRNRLGQIEIGSDEGADLQAQLAAIDAQLELAATDAVRSVSDAVARSSGTVEDLQKQLRQEVLAADLPSGTVTEIYGLQQEATIAQRQYDSMLARLRDVETQALVQLPDSRIVSRALAPNRPYAPDKTVVLLVAGVVGIIGGIAAAFVADASSVAISGPARFIARSGAVIPLAAKSRTALADHVVDAPMGEFAEAFRQLRASVDARIVPAGNRARVVLVTSPLPDEGKSTIALALARTYVEAGKRTLLIDGDLRRPSQHRLTGLSPKAGLLDHLRQPDFLDIQEEIYNSDPKSTLGLITGRKPSEHPTDAPLQSEAFARLMDNAMSAVDVVIIDSAPVLPVVDVRYLVPFADSIVLCAFEGKTPQPAFDQAMGRLAEIVDEKVGIVQVLNGHAADTVIKGYRSYYTAKA